MLNKATIGVAAAGAGVLFLAYCVYFDKKRRSDPLFKEKLRKKRNEQRKKKQESSKMNTSEMPDLRDYESVQKFFINEVQLGEELLGQGDVENGVEHLSAAVAVCGQPHQLLQVLQQTLPPQVFHMLLQRLPEVSQRLTDRASPMGMASGSGGMGGIGGIAAMAEDDVE